MKVLFVTPYITSTAHPTFLRNQTGFGYMVHDIAEYVGKIDEVELFSYMTFTPTMEVDGFQVIGRSWLKWFTNIHFRNIRDGFRFIQKYPQSLKNLIRVLYIFTATGEVENIIEKYDIVHIHGCSAITDAVVAACQRQKVKFLITLHGLNSFEEIVNISAVMKQHEKDFLVKASKEKWPISFISSGNKAAAEGFIESFLER